MRQILIITLCLGVGACGRSTTPPASTSSVPETSAAVAPKTPPTPPKPTTATFEPVYRAAKAVQGATQSGVTFVKFGELMQAFATEISIAKDHEPH